LDFKRTCWTPKIATRLSSILSLVLSKEKSKKIANPTLTSGFNELIPNYKMKPEFISMMVVIVLIKTLIIGLSSVSNLANHNFRCVLWAQGSVLEININ